MSWGDNPGKTIGTDLDKLLGIASTKLGSPQKKPTKPKLWGKSETPHHNDDQLKMTRSNIISLERKNNDLQDSTNLQKQELKLAKVTSTGKSESSQPPTAPAVNFGNIAYNEASVLRE